MDSIERFSIIVVIPNVNHARTWQWEAIKQEGHRFPLMRLGGDDLQKFFVFDQTVLVGDQILVQGVLDG